MSAVLAARGDNHAADEIDAALDVVERFLEMISVLVHMVPDPFTSHDGRDLRGCGSTRDGRHIENDGGECEACGEDY